MIKTFSEILDEQMMSNSSENGGQSADLFYSSHVEYAHFSQIKFVRSASFTRPLNANSRSRYPSQNRISPENPTLEGPADYILESSQKTSFDYFNERLNPTQRLTGHFSALQLKTAFRRLAKVSHPDAGGTTEAFRELIAHFKVLSNFLTKLT